MPKPGGYYAWQLFFRDTTTVNNINNEFWSSKYTYLDECNLVVLINVNSTNQYADSALHKLRIHYVTFCQNFRQSWKMNKILGALSTLSRTEKTPAQLSNDTSTGTFKSFPDISSSCNSPTLHEVGDFSTISGLIDTYLSLYQHELHFPISAPRSNSQNVIFKFL